MSRVCVILLKSYKKSLCVSKAVLQLLDNDIFFSKRFRILYFVGLLRSPKVSDRSLQRNDLMVAFKAFTSDCREAISASFSDMVFWSYYESKKFWSLEEYRIRSKEGIERLVNLMSLSYGDMTLLPYSDEAFSGYQSASAQETRYGISQQIQTNIILCSFGKFLETVKNSTALIKIVENYILSGFKKVQKL